MTTIAGQTADMADFHVPNLALDVAPSQHLSLSAQFRVVSAIQSEALAAGTATQRRKFREHLLKSKQDCRSKKPLSVGPLRVVLGADSAFILNTDARRLGWVYCNSLNHENTLLWLKLRDPVAGTNNRKRNRSDSADHVGRAIQHQRLSLHEYDQAVEVTN